jgi:uncharacterized Ntn-hydrolase superfamily protein
MDEIRLGVERHTFTILAKCPRTGALGIAIATYSLGVGGYCPAINPQAGVLASQAFADPRLRPIGMKILESGSSAEQALKGMQDADSYADYRQIGIVDAKGGVAAYTGPKARDWAGHETGVGYVAMGNVMVGPKVVDAMARTFEAKETEDLEERLLLSIEAGRDAGGQPEGQRSAALIVYRLEESYPWMDLRVDAHDEPVGELRRVYGLYQPMADYYYYLRPQDPANTPTQQEWVAKLSI